MLVEIWSDVLCPWCYLGKRRFEAALARFEHRDAVDVVWRSFELRADEPTVPGRSLLDVMAGYGLDREAALERFEHIRQLGEAEGLTLNLTTARPVNTFDAHRLTHWAAAHGLRGELKERLFRAYHTENLNVADHDVLAGLAGEVGLDADQAREVLAGDAFGEDVRADERRAREVGVGAVPTFLVDGRRTTAGAMSADVLLNLLETAWSERQPHHV
ncbi:putative dithiol-disulfide isomerase, DsbA family [Streptoalloteichus tenebrarius]|uniref:Dithiol-disulfide isomerase, DsbA family n=2 Tax=Streptoalloteichus tenebrarius (strain ATCC 17920 / DSM 40477 / JCM 4838 / CBS 697.72 / NBRC 16177 / NCIMB 11028 / NRRL B-12390 / A12253. 1 / ISP 5477) TaxID=1933 RepID=A0ABT1I2H3_STRSD|nr:putative dithiol-disulfide isomerase, DsbA family [Streptoalloteichus tenebrarius]BFF01283.1 protein disulfide isomerase FrnE [Streptoalloteichus tenebrarius]